MKTSRTSSRPDYSKYNPALIKRAKQYASASLLTNTLRSHYSRKAESQNLSSPMEAAMVDYLRHQREFSVLNHAL